MESTEQLAGSCKLLIVLKKMQLSSISFLSAVHLVSNLLNIYVSSITFSISQAIGVKLVLLSTVSCVEEKSLLKG